MKSQKVTLVTQVILSLSKDRRRVTEVIDIRSWFDRLTMTSVVKFDFLRARHF